MTARWVRDARDDVLDEILDAHRCFERLRLRIYVHEADVVSFGDRDTVPQLPGGLVGAG